MGCIPCEQPAKISAVAINNGKYFFNAKAALEAAQIITKILYRVLEITVDYSLLGLMQKQLHSGGWLHHWLVEFRYARQ